MNYYEVYTIINNNLLAEGSAENCAKIMGITRSAFYTLVFQNKDARDPKYKIIVKKKNKPNRVMGNNYTVYLRATKEKIVEGNAEECARKMERSLHSFYSLVTRVRNGQNQKYEIEVESIDDSTKL